jgi:hypothetical protein
MLSIKRQCWQLQLNGKKTTKINTMSTKENTLQNFGVGTR